MKRTTLLILFFSYLISTHGQCVNNLLNNGSFSSVKGEMVTAPGWTTGSSTPDINDANGPLLSSPNFYWTGTPIPSPNGGTWQNLFSIESVQQTVNVIPGQFYILKFEYAAQGISCGNLIYVGSVGVKIFINGSLVYTTPNDSTQYTWEFASFSFLAQVTTITINLRASQYEYVGIDGACLYPFLINLGNDTTLCKGDSIILNATFTDATYKWQDNSTNPTFKVTQAGTYWVQVNLNGIITSDTINIFYQTPSVNLGNDTTLCQGQTLLLNASNPNCTYIWQDSTTNETYNVSQQNTYWVKVSNQYNCYSYDTINVNYNPLPLVYLGNDTTLCSGQTILLDATLPNSTYLWQDNIQNPTYYVSQQGLYWVQVTTNNCNNSDTINVYYSPPLNLNLGIDTTLCYGNIIKLNASNTNSTYQWQDSSSSSSYIVNQQGTYWVTVIDNNNCSVSDTINITYQSCETPGIYIPNAFTPNGDGLNDVFKIETLKEFKEFNLYIYDRWGELIFDSEDINIGWDGTFKGKTVPDGVYVYLLKATIKDTSEQIREKGRVTVVK